MEKLDLTKKHKAYFTAKPNPHFIEIEPARFLSITGKGDPSGKEFTERIQALYATVYAIKFHYKAEDKDFTVSKLQCQWWFDENKFGNPSMAEAPTRIPRSEWEYRQLIRLPDYVTKENVEQAKQRTVSKKQIMLADNIEFFEMTEGKCVQILHVGPFANEPETLQRMSEWMKEKNLAKNGLHHEIYLSDFRKTVPSKLKTILREPVK